MHFWNVRSIADYDEAITIDPKHASTYYNRGTAWFNKGDDEHAIADFNRTISLDPGFADAFYKRGLSLFRKGNEGAFADFEKALNLDHKNPFGYFGRGVIRTRRQTMTELLPILARQ
ncbi:tetratricopeptide repeat protein [Mesorhizobium sp.]|uniref:tetratricopeptide repeat protein n=1 Tax=Mesorhizobium sp. TaxID=1871066 RepID=UPI0025BD43F6|nr:tetratricopeptide repeat protein [Mesorhizobium sp.]